MRAAPGVTEEALDRWYASLFVRVEFKWPTASVCESGGSPGTPPPRATPGPHCEDPGSRVLLAGEEPEVGGERPRSQACEAGEEPEVLTLVELLAGLFSPNG